MAFESLSPWIDEIDKRLAKGETVSAICKELKIPRKRALVNKYKNERFNVYGDAAIDWEVEKEKTHIQRMAEGKHRIIQEFELFNLMLYRADQILRVGKRGELTVQEAAAMMPIWRDAGKLAVDASNAKMRLSGDDPDSKVAESFLELVKLANQRRSSLDDADSMPE